MNMLTDACKEASVKRVKFTIHSGQRETIQTDLLFFFFLFLDFLLPASWLFS